MKAVIVKDQIIYNNVKVSIEDLFDDDLYKYSNSRATEFYNETYGVNEVFSNLIQYYLCIEQWIQKNNPTIINIKHADNIYRFIAIDICNKYNILIEGNSGFSKMMIWLKYQLCLLASMLYFCYRFLRIPYKDKIQRCENFAILRTKASIKKFKNFSEINQEIESFFETQSIYRLFPRTLRLKWAFKAYRNSFNTFARMYNFYSPLVGMQFKYPLMIFYEKRIVYAEIYTILLDYYFPYFKDCKFYTGNNLDRYSVIEDQMCEKYNIRSYCIPHGIEYGFRFPKGFSCDVFYVHCQYAADYLNNLYGTDKYVYEEEIIRRMFDYHYENNHERMVVFFTEPREINVNIDILNSFLPKLKEYGVKLYIKLHPGDCKNNYENMDVEFLTDYNLSMTGNICISRKSTILLEAIYNKSIPIAIITTPKDQTLFSLFPSLNAEQIIKTYNVNELFETITKILSDA